MTDIGANRRWLHRALVVSGLVILIVAGVGLVYGAADVFLLLFAAILLAVLLHEASARLRRLLPMPHVLALALVLALTAMVLVAAALTLAPGVIEQAAELGDAIPRAVERLQRNLRDVPAARKVVAMLPDPEALVTQSSALFVKAQSLVAGLVGALANAVIIVVVAIYLAAHPGIYLHGTVTLFPPRMRRRAEEVMLAIRHTLAGWLMGKLFSMLAVGLVTVIGLSLLEVPLALILGVLAGLLDFIPYLGPILAGIPAVLVAFSERPTLALNVILLFVVIQAIEGYLLVPLIERRTVSLPPALTIMAQVLLGGFFGLAGVALATPLTAVLAVMVVMLYLQDRLGEPIKVPGDG